MRRTRDEHCLRGSIDHASDGRDHLAAILGLLACSRRSIATRSIAPTLDALERVDHDSAARIDCSVAANRRSKTTCRDLERRVSWPAAPNNQIWGPRASRKMIVEFEPHPGSSAAWQRTCFGSRRSGVQIPPPRLIGDARSVRRPGRAPVPLTDEGNLVLTPTKASPLKLADCCRAAGSVDSAYGGGRPFAPDRMGLLDLEPRCAPPNHGWRETGRNSPLTVVVHRSGRCQRDISVTAWLFLGAIGTRSLRTAVIEGQIVS